jgi:hypothetical protein
MQVHQGVLQKYGRYGQDQAWSSFNPSGRLRATISSGNWFLWARLVRADPCTRVPVEFFRSQKCDDGVAAGRSSQSKE